MDKLAVAENILTSMGVAGMVEKQYAHLMRDIENYINHLENG
ncbi:hypothetical protein PDN73_29065 [Bacillus cereus]|nr:hypothetical protein [Bacillus cereus]